MSYPRYAKYKDSGVPWLGEVPAHWAVDRFKRSTVSCKNGIWGDEPQGDDSDIVCVRVADFDREKRRVQLTEPTIRNVSNDERKGRLLRPGDLLLEKSGGGENQPVGCVVLFEYPAPAVCSNFVARVVLSPGMNSSFWRYQHAVAYAAGVNTRSIKQTSGIQNLDQQQYLDERAAFPPSDEQATIAAFLDKETDKLDALVAEHQRLIDLLNEKRQASIARAVTTGIRRHAKVKSSGIPCIGDLPAGWNFGPLKHFWDVIDCKHVTADFVDDGIPVASIREVQGRWVSLDDAKCTTEGFYEQLIEGRRLPRAGDLIFSRNATVGEVAQVRPDHSRFAMGQDVVLLRRRLSDASPDYFQHVLRSPVVRQSSRCS